MLESQIFLHALVVLPSLCCYYPPPLHLSTIPGVPTHTTRPRKIQSASPGVLRPRRCPLSREKETIHRVPLAPLPLACCAVLCCACTPLLFLQLRPRPRPDFSLRACLKHFLGLHLSHHHHLFSSIHARTTVSSTTNLFLSSLCVCLVRLRLPARFLFFPFQTVQTVRKVSCSCPCCRRNHSRPAACSAPSAHPPSLPAAPSFYPSLRGFFPSTRNLV